MSEKVIHTPEPWVCFRDGKTIWIEQSTTTTPVVFWTGFDSGDLPLKIKEANARRIVACVNACKGIEMQTLEAAASRGGIGVLKVLADNLELRQQRDQLAEALRYWLPDESLVIPLNYNDTHIKRWHEHIALLSTLKEQGQ